MIGANFDQRRSTVLRQFLAVGEWGHIVGSAMQDHRAELDVLDRAVLLPRRAKQHELRRAAVDIHGHGTAS